ncbi:uncharacterized protein LOC141596761 isoform X1 [Silene latifolia]|uniref:uncharacterized protein LOC141596761 isoform X1 n=1 Tax=Silene latifolia TaxID=37657 RepID=UPI003D77A9D3
MWCTGATTSALQWGSFPNQNSPKSVKHFFTKNCPFLAYFHKPTKLNLSKSTPTLVNCSSSTHGLGSPDQNFLPQDQSQDQGNVGFWEKWKVNSAEMSAKLAKLGLAALLAYGLFDAVTYTSFFVLAFLGYEKSTGKNPAANIQALIGIVIMMWTGNNVTRPFRVAGAAALAPTIDNGLRRVQKALNFPTLFYAFALVVGIVASSCLTIIGLLILSRWGK